MSRVIYDLRDYRKDIWISRDRARALYEEGKLIIYQEQGYGANEKTPKLKDEGRYV